MRVTLTTGRFEAGSLVITPGAEREVSPEEQFVTLVRHLSGDWGDLGEHDWSINDDALEYGGRLKSRYGTKSGTVFFIITDESRRQTTILLPGED